MSFNIKIRIARNTGRRFIVSDQSAEYCAIARNRLAQPYTVPMFTEQVELSA